MINALSVDVEEYFHVEAFASVVKPDQWALYPSRVEANVERILEIFSRFEVRATFYVLGWVAERYPRLVSKIQKAGHEIASHGYGHQHLRRLSPGEFREDIRRSSQCLSDQAGSRIELFRAPTFSVIRQTLWALDVLSEEGFKLDSSIFPVKHDLYGIPGSERFPHWRKTRAGNLIFEFPPSTVRCLGNDWGVGGGGYLRILPYSLTRWAIRRINEKDNQPVMVYVHPWELDPEQPRLPAGIRSRIRHYTNLGKMKERMNCLLKDFQFDTVSQVCRQLSVYQSNDSATVQPHLTGSLCAE